MSYYFANKNVQQGPFELNQLLEKGLRPDSLVWTDGMKDWVRADSVPDVAPHLSFCDFGGHGSSALAWYGC